MSLPGEIKRRLNMLVHRRRFRDELDEEMQLHLELRQQQQIALGLRPEDSRTAAMRRFGNTTRIWERSQMVWGWGWLESLLQDVVYGIRAMLRSPVLTMVALLSLALGIGANAAIFSFLDAVLLRSLPVEDPQRLVLLGTADSSGITDAFACTEFYSYPFYRQFQAKNAVFSLTAAIFSMTNDVHGFVENRTESEPMQVQLVSGTYFATLGVKAQLGRMLTDADDTTEGNHPVAVTSQRFWKRSLAGDPEVVGRTVTLGNTMFTIVGLAPPEFFGTKVGDAPDLWVPLLMTQSVPPG